MATVGLFFVGAVLFVNGLSLLGATSARSAAPLNLFVGAMQVALPTLAIVLARGELEASYAVAATFLFGFTYLFVGIDAYTGSDGSGLGWFSAFVAVSALWFGTQAWATDPVFTVVWLLWALMWTMFFAVLALGRTELVPFTGWLLVLGSHVTATVPALLLFEGSWPTSRSAAAVALLVALAVVAAAAALARSRPTIPSAGTPSAEVHH